MRAFVVVGVTFLQVSRRRERECGMRACDLHADLRSRCLVSERKCRVVGVIFKSISLFDSKIEGFKDRFKVKVFEEK